ncbi:MAG: MBL fold metallo-hydrolase [Bacteroidales bacterium]
MTKLSTLETGFFHSDGGAMFGLLPKMIWNRHYYADNKNLCQMAMRCLLYKKKERIILFDTGTGSKEDKRLAPYGFFRQKELKELLTAHQIKAEAVTDIVLSHLHFDHCGAISEMSDNGVLKETFPNAHYYISKAQWIRQQAPGLLDQDAYFKENIFFLNQNPRLHLIDTNFQLTEEVELCLYEGHTLGQIVSFIRTAEGTRVFAGDVMPLALNIHPECISAFDLTADVSITERIRLIKQIVAEDAFVYFYHDAYTIGAKIRKTGTRFMLYEKQTVG